MRLKALAAVSAAALIALGGIALAAVRVYHNKFEGKGDAKELDLSGKGCEAEVRGGKNQLGVTTSEGGSRCRLRLPVQADQSQPDHIVDVQAKLLPKTPEQIREKVYVALTVREGGGGYYELRVYPEKRKFSLTRKPGDSAFPVTGKDRDIGKTGDKNKLTLRAIGDAVGAKINKTTIDEIVDPQPGALPGTKLSLVLGQEGGSSEGASVWFRDLRVSVPNP
jgi:hypothetical protein